MFTRSQAKGKKDKKASGPRFIVGALQPGENYSGTMQNPVSKEEGMSGCSVVGDGDMRRAVLMSRILWVWKAGEER